MDRITQSGLLADSHDLNSSGWFVDNILHPFENGTGVRQIYNNFVKEDKQLAPAYVPETKTLSTDWVVHTLASASGAVLTYALAAKATNMGLSAISSAAGLEGAAARTLNSMGTAQIVGAGLYDLSKAPNPGETRLGNALGSMAAFGVFTAGNNLIGQSEKLSRSLVLGGIGRVGVGMAGGLTSLEASHMISKSLGVQSDITWNDRWNAMAGGGFINVAMPFVQKGVSTVVDGALNSKPFQFEPPKTAVEEAGARLAKPNALGIAGNLDRLPQDVEVNSVARAGKAGTAVDAQLPELILLKQQFEGKMIQAQMERVATKLADFIGDAKKSVDTAVYDFRFRNEAVENTVVGAYNKAAESGVQVRIAFFEAPEAKADGAKGYANIPKPGGPVFDIEIPIARGPSPELLAKLSPKIAVQKFNPTESGAAAIPDPLGSVLGEAKPGAAKSGPGYIDLQTGKNGSMSGDVGSAAIKGDGHLMHNKYVVVDAGTKNGKVWTGSTNFTDDAFGSQDNNIVIIKSPTIANAFAKNFNQMWEAGTLTGTGANLHTTAETKEGSITVGFSPGDGAWIDAEFASRFANAKESVHIASMVISSPQMLKALVDNINNGIKVTGIYDGPQMDQVERNWSKFKTSKEKLEMWNQVKEHLVRKESHPYTPDGIHDFLHNKMYVVDGKNAGTGSFNFSKNATMNAENVVIMDNMPTVAKQYQTYINDLIKTYDGQPLRGEPIVTKPPVPQMSAEQAHTTFREMVAAGQIPHGKFVDSVAGQKYPLTPKQLEIVLEIIAKNRKH